MSEPLGPVWCWQWHRAARRLLFDPMTGRITRTWTVPEGTKPFAAPMAGFVKKSLGGPTALYTPDGERVLLQNRREHIDLAEANLEVVERVGRATRSLLVRSPRTGTAIRLRTGRVEESTIDPLDDPWLVTVHRFATSSETRSIAHELWDAAGKPEGRQW